MTVIITSYFSNIYVFASYLFCIIHTQETNPYINSCFDTVIDTAIATCNSNNRFHLSITSTSAAIAIAIAIAIATATCPDFDNHFGLVDAIKIEKGS